MATELEMILDQKGNILSGPTNADPRSHYGQPVFRAEEEIEVGDEIVLVYDANDPDLREQVRIIWKDDKDGWIITYNPQSMGSDVLCIHPDSGVYGRPEDAEGSVFESLEYLRDCVLPTEQEQPMPEDILGLKNLCERLVSAHIRAEGTIHLGDGLGCIMS